MVVVIGERRPEGSAAVGGVVAAERVGDDAGIAGFLGFDMAEHPSEEHLRRDSLAEDGVARSYGWPRRALPESGDQGVQGSRLVAPGRATWHAVRSQPLVPQASADDREGGGTTGPCLGVRALARGIGAPAAEQGESPAGLRRLLRLWGAQQEDERLDTVGNFGGRDEDRRRTFALRFASCSGVSVGSRRTFGDGTAESERMEPEEAAAGSKQRPSLSGPHIHTGAGRQGDDCPICLEPMVKGRALFAPECGHMYHFDCIKENVRHGNMTCPLCRHQLQDLPSSLATPRTGLRTWGVEDLEPSSLTGGSLTSLRDLQRARSHIAEQRAAALEMMAAAEERIAMVRAAHAEVHSHVRLAQQLVERISNRRQQAVGSLEGGLADLHSHDPATTLGDAADPTPFPRLSTSDESPSPVGSPSDLRSPTNRSPSVSPPPFQGPGFVTAGGSNSRAPSPRSVLSLSPIRSRHVARSLDSPEGRSSMLPSPGGRSRPCSPFQPESSSSSSGYGLFARSGTFVDRHSRMRLSPGLGISTVDRPTRPHGARAEVSLTSASFGLRTAAAPRPSPRSVRNRGRSVVPICGSSTAQSNSLAGGSGSDCQVAEGDSTAGFSWVASPGAIRGWGLAHVVPENASVVEERGVGRGAGGGRTGGEEEEVMEERHAQEGRAAMTPSTANDVMDADDVRGAENVGHGRGRRDARGEEDARVAEHTREERGADHSPDRLSHAGGTGGGWAGMPQIRARIAKAWELERQGWGAQEAGTMHGDSSWHGSASTSSGAGRAAEPWDRNQSGAALRSAWGVPVQADCVPAAGAPNEEDVAPPPRPDADAAASDVGRCSRGYITGEPEGRRESEGQMGSWSPRSSGGRPARWQDGAASSEGGPEAGVCEVGCRGRSHLVLESGTTTAGIGCWSPRPSTGRADRWEEGEASSSGGWEGVEEDRACYGSGRIPKESVKTRKAERQAAGWSPGRREGGADRWQEEATSLRAGRGAAAGGVEDSQPSCSYTAAEPERTNGAERPARRWSPRPAASWQDGSLSCLAGEGPGDVGPRGCSGDILTILTAEGGPDLEEHQAGAWSPRPRLGSSKGSRADEQQEGETSSKGPKGWLISPRCHTCGSCLGEEQEQEQHVGCWSSRSERSSVAGE